MEPQLTDTVCNLPYGITVFTFHPTQVTEHAPP